MHLQVLLVHFKSHHFIPEIFSVIQLKIILGYAQQFFDPIKVPVNRPFVFAIVDNEMDLAIMVGRVLNPINSRIF